MALYWPEQKVALEIVDDPLARPVDRARARDWDIVSITMADVGSAERMREVGDELCRLMGTEPPEKTPEWIAANNRLHSTLMGML